MAVFEKRAIKGGGFKYRVKVRVKGRPVESHTFDRLTDAKRWAAQIETEMRNGRHFPKAESRKHTLADLIDRYVETYLPKKSRSMQECQAVQLAWWRKQLGGYLLADINSALVTEYRDKLMSEKISGGGTRTAATGNRYLAALSHALSVGSREWQWLEDNPLRNIRKFKESSGRTRFLDDDERGRLLKQCKLSGSKYLELIVLVAISTGMRLNEILTLTWKQVNFRERAIILDNTKNEESRRVPVQGEAFARLETHSKIRRIDTDLVFPAPSGPQKPISIRTAWRNAVRRAALGDFCFHDLRHTAASYFAMSGASARDLCEIFGWKKMQMAMRYAHLYDSHTSELAAKMNERFLGRL